MPVSGSAARTAASNRLFRKSRGADIVIGGLCCLGVDVGLSVILGLQDQQGALAAP
jgi:hypothetical protein